MALTINTSMESNIVGDEYLEPTAVAAGDQLIIVLPKNGMVTFQLNAASPTDAVEVLSTIEKQKDVKNSSDLTLFATETTKQGDQVLRTFDNGCTAYAFNVTSGTYTIRARALLSKVGRG